MHSYWDQLFALRGYTDAVFVAEALGERAEARRLARLRDAFAADLAASYRLAMAKEGLNVLPGSVELGDFDPTSVSVALDPVEAGAVLPAGALERTYDRYWTFFEARRDGDAWNDYTPYEWRNVDARSSAWASPRARARPRAGFSATAGPQRGTPLPRSSGARPARRASSATSRTRGSAPTSSAPRSTCSPTRTGRTASSSGPASTRRGSPSRSASTGSARRAARCPFSKRARARRSPSSSRATSRVPAGGIAVTSPLGRPRTATVGGRRARLDAGPTPRVTVRSLPARVVFTY